MFASARFTPLAGVVVSAIVLLWGASTAWGDEPIRQFQDDRLLGYESYWVDRSWDGIGPESGLLTRSRIVTKGVHATPDFVVEGPPYSRSADYVEYNTRTPSDFGVPSDREVRIFVRVNNTYITLDPFQTLRERVPQSVRRAQRKWLRDNGYVNSARLLKRAPRWDAVDWSQREESMIPTPRATIEVHPGLRKRADEPKAIEASSRPSRGIVIYSPASSNLEELSSRIKGSIRVQSRSAEELQVRADD